MIIAHVFRGRQGNCNCNCDLIHKAVCELANFQRHTYIDINVCGAPIVT